METLQFHVRHGQLRARVRTPYAGMPSKAPKKGLTRPRAPDYLQSLKNQLKIQRSKQGVNPNVAKGPLIDSCADIPVVPASFKSK